MFHSYIDATSIHQYQPLSHSHTLILHSVSLTYHDGLGVAPQRVLQQSGELGVAVGDVRGLPIHQTGDDVPQHHEGEVDLPGLLQPLPLCVSLVLPLRSLATEEREGEGSRK